MSSKTYIDQLGREVVLPEIPKRIICLVPSITELVAYFEMDEEVVGITKFCVYPTTWFQNKERVGGTKNIDIDKVSSLHPDLIIGNKEENTKDDIAALMAIAPVWMSDVNSIEDANNLVASLAEIFNKQNKGQALIGDLKKYFLSHASEGAGKSVLYFIWHSPGFVAGKNTYIDSYLTAIGYQNCVIMDRYPDISTLESLDPDVVLLSSEPFPFNESHVAYYKELFPNAEIKLVDGERYSWYGVRTLLC
jgi:ABC-type Fe3+-hydroxamate transport system substrate-binding protein